MADGKVAFHGRTAANPRGCPGTGEPPLRRHADGTETEQTGATVIGFRPDTPADPPPPTPADQVDVPVERRSGGDLDLGLRIKPPPPLPPTA